MRFDYIGMGQKAVARDSAAAAATPVDAAAAKGAKKPRKKK